MTSPNQRPSRDALDRALASLSADVPPSRDLWPGIQAEIAKTPIVTDRAPVVHFAFSRWFQLAAGVVLVLATSFTTYFVTRESIEQEVATQMAQQEVLPAPTLNAMPVAFGSETLGADYMKARTELDRMFEQHLANLPPSARARIERSLADLRHAANDIAATLAEHPSDPLLQDLLMSTYQRELQMFADVSEMATPASTRTDL